VAQQDLEVASAELAAAFRAIQGSIGSGNDALDRFASAVTQKISSGKQRIATVQMTAKVERLQTEAHEVVKQVEAATSDVESTQQKCVTELNNLTAAVSQLDGHINQFVATSRASLVQVTNELQALDTLVATKKTETEAHFQAWIGSIPGMQQNMTGAQSDYADVVAHLAETSDGAYQELSAVASSLSHNTIEEMRRLAEHFGAAATSMTASTEAGFAQALSVLQQNAAAAEHALDGAVGDLEQAAQRINDDAGKVLDIAGKVADLLRAIKPVTDTLSAVT
jgi:hypothetical protein